MVLDKPRCMECRNAHVPAGLLSIGFYFAPSKISGLRLSSAVGKSQYWEAVAALFLLRLLSCPELRRNPLLACRGQTHHSACPTSQPEDGSHQSSAVDHKRNPTPDSCLP